MKAISIYQPWATLILLGAKPNEFRKKSFLEYIGHPAVGDRCVIQASARPMRLKEIDDLLDRLMDDDEQTGLVIDKALGLMTPWRHALAQKQQPLPLMQGLGTVLMGTPALACDLFKLDVADSDRGKFNWAWPMSEPVLWEQPVPCRGLQGFFDWPFQVPA